MKFWSIVTLLLFLNFTALPGIAAVFGWDLTRTNVVISEEEPHSHPSTFVVYEKTLPKTLDVFDYLKFFEPDLQGKSFILIDDSFHLSPLLTIFSPPPEA
ncbi:MULTISPECIES: hypothetical protein [Chryseobacterium]|jgi:hypothetical protein|uniref:Uncharacterized protein n=1 Tax=Chryseobacterium geocarposphaerae TaxID=1416776 RepID=A0ABU1LFM3_9FLAO|nr:MULTISPECIES: hypothetical protein [Chryseobacterium]ALR31855.1 hypothetical protein ATE47_15635 [Chryseobacterium sp. IHB B 17019]MDR6405375.1 hypothetical protein [Chryseobacterium geocarposphaerae]MDR6697534.1 hypothetical protein [Chryseobacterium ginsenosidimutans]